MWEKVYKLYKCNRAHENKVVSTSLTSAFGMTDRFKIYRVF